MNAILLPLKDFQVTVSLRVSAHTEQEAQGIVRHAVYDLLSNHLLVRADNISQATQAITPHRRTADVALDQRIAVEGEDLIAGGHY